MKTLLLSITTAFLLLTQPTLASEKAACKCDHKCTEACKKGEGSKTCDCKACDCAKTGECPHHKCGGDHSEAEKTKK